MVGEKKDYSLETESVVVERAQELVGKSLRELYGDAVGRRKGKGAFGQLIEQLHFGYDPNPSPEVDFPVAGLELKATGAVPTRSGWAAKERLVLSNINYFQIASEEDFETSTFYLKNARLLVVVYYWRANCSPIEYRILGVGVIDIEEMDPTDRAIIQDDWRKIREAIIQGRAHELSEGDTTYLKATRKGAGTGLDDRKQPFNVLPAPNRAFSYRQSFLTRLMRPFVEGARVPKPGDEQPVVQDPLSLRERTFDDLVLGRFERFKGRTVDDIAAEVAPDLNRQAKGYYAALARRMLGVTSRRIEEFEKAEIIMKTVRVGRSGRPKEAMSFPAFRYRELVEQEWLDSDLREDLSKRFLFVFYRVDKDRVWFHHAAFWAMPETVLDGEVKRVWEETVERIKCGRAHDLPGSSESPVAHVRPHGRNAADTDETPLGRHLTRKSFWLNASYIGEIFQATAKAEDD